MIMCNRAPGQTFWPLLLGSVEEAIGLGVLTWAVMASRPKIVSGMMVVTGAGTGSRFMPASLHVAGVWPERLAPAMSLMRFAMPFGGTLALTIMNAVFNSKFTSATSSLTLPIGNGNSGGISAQDTQSLDTIGQLPSALQATVRAAGREAVGRAFISILPILGISVLACFVLGNVWVKAKKDKSAGSTVPGQGSGGQSSEKVATGASAVVHVPYLYALLKVTILILFVPSREFLYTHIHWTMSTNIALSQGVNRYKHESRMLPATQGHTIPRDAQAAKPFIGRGV